MLSIRFCLSGMLLLFPYLALSVLADGKAFAQQVPATPKADLAIIDTRILLCNSEMEEADAIAIRDGRIVALGKEQVDRWIAPNYTKVVQAPGWTATAGFTDSHLHFLGLGQSLQMLDLREAKSWAEIVELVKAAAEQLPAGTWIVGRGWHQSKWNHPPHKNVDGYPHHASLSEKVPSHPVLLTHASGHACFANLAAMELAQVTADTPSPEGGEILRDASGAPCGVFRENAQGLIRSAKSRTEQRQAPEKAMRSMREIIRLAGERCLKYGITSVHDAGSSFSTAQAFEQLASEGALPLRVLMMARAGSTELAQRLPRSKVLGAGDDFFTLRSVKVSIDGALGPHGAWLLQPYSDLTNTSGLNTVALEELKSIASLCKQHGWQLCVHAIGDRANREVLNVFEEVLGSMASADHRWRIEHAQHLSVADIPRFAELGVIPAMQANHCTSDAIFVPQRLGERRSQEGAYVWRSLIDTGAIVPNGTDAPVERVDPRASLYAAVTRKLSNGEQFYPEQCMTRAEAILSYTLWPAIASFQERNLGSLEVGKRADLVFWDQDLLRCPSQDILTAEVQLTLLDGKIVYERAQ